MRFKKRKILVDVYDDKKAAGQFIANEIRSLVVQRQRENKTCMIGLTPGRSPHVVLNELKRMHNLGKLSFYNVYIVLTDEFFPCSRDGYSYLRFLSSTFLSKIDIPKSHIISPCDLTSAEEAAKYCYDLPSRIKKLGGIDITLMGIGQEGVIGFNEPGTSISAPSRLLHLNHKVHPELEALAIKLEKMPERAISLGIRTLLKSREIFLLAWGPTKANAMYEAISAPVNPASPASYLQFHNSVTAYVDYESGKYLIEDFDPKLPDRHQKEIVSV